MLSIEKVKSQVVDLLDEVGRREYGTVGDATQQLIAVTLGSPGGFVYEKSWTFVSRAGLAVACCNSESALIKVRDILEKVLNGEKKESLESRVTALEELVTQQADLINELWYRPPLSGGPGFDEAREGWKKDTS